MRKFIFIHMPHDIGGLAMIDQRNLKILQRCGFSCCENIQVKLSSKKDVFSSLYFFKSYNLTDESYNQIISSILINKPDFIFFSHSLLGEYIRLINKNFPNILIISFFHNVEYVFNKKSAINRLDLRSIMKLPFSFKSEQLTMMYSNYIFTLNNRDRSLLKKIYNKNSLIELLPTSLENKVVEIDFDKYNNYTRLRLLFVGTNFFANNYAVKWLVKNVYPFLNNCELNIVGKGMDNLKDEIGCFKDINFIGEVTDAELDKFYKTSHLFISPIFHGGGMKTKIAEAMMYGLPILGTQESFEGYEFDSSLIGLKTEKASDFVEFINNIDASHLIKYSQASRGLFLKKYSFEASFVVLNNYLSKFL